MSKGVIVIQVAERLKLQASVLMGACSDAVYVGF